MPVPEDPRRLRASDADRDAVAERLREAAGDGRISLDELEERLGATYAARTYEDLEAVVADLPSPAALPARAAGDMRLTAVHRTVRRAGQWSVPGQVAATAVLGEVKLDFTDAELTSREVVVEARVVLGDVLLLVPEGWAVRTDEVRCFLGAVKDKRMAPARPGAPVLRVRGIVTMGDLTVRHPRSSRFLPR